jgi:predicted dehydrogenase
MTPDRRQFTLAGATAAAATLIPTAVHAAGDDTLKVGLIGCGGRGSGAVKDAFEAAQAAGANIVLHAVGDVFEGKAQGQAKSFAANKTFGSKVKLDDRVFGGLDAYQKVIDSGVDLVILATPPGFRPTHLEAAVKAKKHIFCEKPVAVDGPGLRKCLSLVEEIKRNGTALVAGTQRRHQAGYIETVKRIHDGAIGEVTGGRCSWNGTGIWFHKRKPNASDVEYQLDNWYHFLWACGDHIVEQHVHNLDVINWVLRAHPIRATAIGGRSYRDDGKPGDANFRDPAVWGHIWDHFAVELEYPNGVTIASYCAHIPGIQTDISESVVGTKGSARVDRYTINKQSIKGDSISPYVQEHIDLLNSIRSGKPLNELQAVTESTATAILGREAAYTGRVVKWDDLLNAKNELVPADLTLKGAIKPMAVPVPGKYKLV